MPSLEARWAEFLVNAAWQVPVLWLAAAVADGLLLRRCEARVRYWFWLVALLAAAGLPWMPRWNWPGAPGLRISLEALGGTGEAGEAAVAVPWLFWCGAGWWAARWAWIALSLWRLRTLTEHTARVPVTFGRRIVMPRAFLARAAERAIRAAWAHEAAHRARRDFAWNLAVEVLTAPVAWHPALWWMRRRWAGVRELACDEQAAQTFASRQDYAQGLWEAVSVLTATARAHPALGLLDGNSFEERMEMLISPVRFLSPRASRGALAAAALLLTVTLGVTAALSVAVAQAPAERAETEPPQVRYKVEPKYTEAAREAKITGNVRLTLVVNESGVPEKVEVAEGLDAGLDQRAVDAVSQWRFQPARRGGKAVPFAATIEVHFRLVD